MEAINMKIPLISIILPVYKVGDYLAQCVESILTQPFRDYEMILVNDGSPDGCPAMCDAYAAKDSRVKVIHKENGGLSDARNAAMRVAVGKYFMLLDSDDFIAENSLEKIAVALVSEPDVLFTKSLCLYPDGRTTVYGSPFAAGTFDGMENAADFLSRVDPYHVSVWSKIVKRDFIIENEIFFTKGLYTQDVDWSIEVYIHAKTYDCCTHDNYFYRVEREGSITSVFTEKRFADNLWIISRWEALAKGKYSSHRDIIYRFLNHQFWFLLTSYRIHPNRKLYRKDMRRLWWLVGVTKNNLGSVAARLIYRMCGPYFSSKLYQALRH